MSEKNSSFSAIYQEWYAHKCQVWSEEYATELQRMFETDIPPLIGAKEMDEIEPIVVPLQSPSQPALSFAGVFFHHVAVTFIKHLSQAAIL